IREFGLDAVARLTPYCADMAAGMNALDCLVLPQVGTEAIPGVVCEAHACGIPVVASDLDGIPEAFQPAGFGTLVERGSIDQLAAAMVDWARKPGPEMPARWAIHDRVAKVFSLERAAYDLSSFYESLRSPA